MKNCPRIAALKILKDVCHKNISLSEALSKSIKSDNIAFTKEITFGVLRWYEQLHWLCQQLLSNGKQTLNQDIELIILIGLYQLRYCRLPSHAAVNSTVTMCDSLKKTWAKGLVNAILRNYLRQQEALDKKILSLANIQYSHPQWLINKIRQAYPDNWQSILEANQQHAPLTLRINARQTTREDYQHLLHQAEISNKKGALSAQAILLEHARSIEELPKFKEGFCSVQDEAAQLAAHLLDLKNGLKVLDACAAPGGKSCHLLELADINLLAIDKDVERCKKITENLQRLRLAAQVKCADAADPDSWWDKQLFDRILLDAPCSALGVIRRHPDIKLHRQANDIKALANEQQKILAKLWPLLKPGGILLYATCSILPEENQQQIEHFLAKNSDAVLDPIHFAELKQNLSQNGGIMDLQILPSLLEMDGFYYAKLIKKR